MNFFKPKFWDKNKISFFSIIFYPIALLIKFLFFFKDRFHKNTRIFDSYNLCWKYLCGRDRKNTIMYRNIFNFEKFKVESSFY